MILWGLRYLFMDSLQPNSAPVSKCTVMARPIFPRFWCTSTVSQSQRTDRGCHAKSSSSFSNGGSCLYCTDEILCRKKTGGFFLQLRLKILTDSVHHWSIECNNAALLSHFNDKYFQSNQAFMLSQISTTQQQTDCAAGIITIYHFVLLKHSEQWD